jgi:hypothetical protein
LVAISFPFNGALILETWSLLAEVLSVTFAESHHAVVFAVAGVLHLGLFMILACGVSFATRRRPLRFRNAAVLRTAGIYSTAIVVLFFLYVGPALSHL